MAFVSARISEIPCSATAPKKRRLLLSGLLLQRFREVVQVGRADIRDGANFHAVRS
jgi:hypothetical protein